MEKIQKLKNLQGKVTIYIFIVKILFIIVKISFTFHSMIMSHIPYKRDRARGSYIERNRFIDRSI